MYIYISILIHIYVFIYISIYTYIILILDPCICLYSDLSGKSVNSGDEKLKSETVMKVSDTGSTDHMTGGSDDDGDSSDVDTSDFEEGDEDEVYMYMFLVYMWTHLCKFRYEYVNVYGSIHEYVFKCIFSDVDTSDFEEGDEDEVNMFLYICIFTLIYEFMCM
jgi:hypothetical protein